MICEVCGNTRRVSSYEGDSLCSFCADIYYEDHINHEMQNSSQEIITMEARRRSLIKQEEAGELDY